LRITIHDNPVEEMTKNVDTHFFKTSREKDVYLAQLSKLAGQTYLGVEGITDYTYTPRKGQIKLLIDEKSRTFFDVPSIVVAKVEWCITMTIIPLLTELPFLIAVD